MGTKQQKNPQERAVAAPGSRELVFILEGGIHFAKIFLILLKDVSFNKKNVIMLNSIHLNTREYPWRHH
jgi:hypothetical protein